MIYEHAYASASSRCTRNDLSHVLLGLVVGLVGIIHNGVRFDLRTIASLACYLARQDAGSANIRKGTD